MKNVLIVRLDAIGDYILWRNVLAFIRHSAAYRSSRITVLGNPAWRSLAEGFDAALADEWIWVENRRRLFRMGYENLLPGCIWRRRVEKEQARLREPQQMSATAAERRSQAWYIRLLCWAFWLS